ncbi:MAG: phage capsid protein [Verrucomicrobiota bacterium JB024]|nr:phage capsid protein [Verrucomicrobiota bacterium JB024]
MLTDFKLAHSMFSDTVRELAGAQDRSLLKELVGYEKVEGEIAYLPSIDDASSDEATVTDAKSTKTRKTYEAIETPALADWIGIQTPHMAVGKQKTTVTPKVIEWGHSFGKNEKVLDKLTSQDRVMRSGMKKIFKQEDLLIIGGMSAASVARVVGTANGTTTSNVALPASQAFETANVGYLSFADCTTIMKLLEDQYVTDPVFCLMSPTDKKLFIDNNEKINDTDFVNSHEYFHSGKLPDVYGIHFVSHPLVTPGTLHVWAKEAIIWADFQGLDPNIGPAPTQRFSAIAHMDELADVKRNDDLKYIKVTIKAS